MDNIYETINSIIDINCVTTESDLGVLNALHDAYTKAYTIMENDENDISSFSIFQEGQIMDQVKKEGKNDSVMMKIILFIPRIIKAMMNQLHKQTKDENIKDVVKKADKIPDKKPNIIKRFFQSKPMKAICIATSTAAIIETSKIIKDTIDQTKQLKATTEDIQKAVEVMDKAIESIQPACMFDVNDRNQLIISSNCNLRLFNGIYDRYKKNIDRMLRKRIPDLRACTNYTQVQNVLLSIALDVVCDISVFEQFVGDGNFYEPMPIEEFNDICSKTFFDMKNDDGSYFSDLLKDLTDAIPVDKISKDIVGKAQQIGPLKEKMVAPTNELVAKITERIQYTMISISKIANNMRKDIRAVLIELIKTENWNGVEPEPGTPEHKQFGKTLNSTLKGKKQFEKSENGDISFKKETTENQSSDDGNK